MTDDSISTSSPSARSTMNNPWVQGSVSVGIVALAVGLLLAVLGGPGDPTAAEAGPAIARLVAGIGLAAAGVALLLSALVIAGVGWYLQQPGSVQSALQHGD